MTKEDIKILFNTQKLKKEKEEKEYLKKMQENQIRFEDCKEGYTYKVDARNFEYAIFYNDQFYGIRHKFGDVYIDAEIHWDKDDRHGTARPQVEIEETPKNIFNIFKFYINTKYHTDKKDRFDIAFNVIQHYLDTFKN